MGKVRAGDKGGSQIGHLLLHGIDFCLSWRWASQRREKEKKYAKANDVAREATFIDLLQLPASNAGSDSRLPSNNCPTSYFAPCCC